MLTEPQFSETVGKSLLNPEVKGAKDRKETAYLTLLQKKYNLSDLPKIFDKHREEIETELNTYLADSYHKGKAIKGLRISIVRNIYELAGAEIPSGLQEKIGELDEKILDEFLVGRIGL